MKIETGGILRFAAIVLGFSIALGAAILLRAPIEEWEFKAMEIRARIAEAGLSTAPEDHRVYIGGFRHAEGMDEPLRYCSECHPISDVENPHSCAWCHQQVWGGVIPPDHELEYEGYLHAQGGEEAYDNCSSCHGKSLRGGIGGSCRDCHHLPVWRGH
ncbi:MAG: hypothetical protein Kow00107_11510 [Planctomycetota bacterium]